MGRDAHSGASHAALVAAVKRTELVRKTALRFRSAKRAREYRTQRRPLVAAMLDERPICERCNAARSTEVHELLSRARGGSITDPGNCVCLCSACHSTITTNPAKATAEGWLLNSWGTK